MSQNEDYCWLALQLFEEGHFNESQSARQKWQHHLSSCSICQQDSDIQSLIETWKSLDTLTVPELSVDFDNALLLQIQVLDQERLQRKMFWKRMDMFVDFLHIPAVAVVLTLLVWVGTASQEKQAQVPERQIEKMEVLQEKIQALNEMTVQESLGKIQSVYLQRNEG